MSLGFKCGIRLQMKKSFWNSTNEYDKALLEQYRKEQECPNLLQMKRKSDNTMQQNKVNHKSLKRKSQEGMKKAMIIRMPHVTKISKEMQELLELGRKHGLVPERTKHPRNRKPDLKG
jgi:hypothetical protein